MTMPKFPFKRDDHCINRSAASRAEVTATAMWTGTATAIAEVTVRATAIDMYGLRWQWPDGWWHELYFSSRGIER